MVAGLSLLAFGFLELKPLQGIGLLVGSILAMLVVSVAAFLNGLVLPYLVWAALAILSYMVLYCYRVFFEDRWKHRYRRSDELHGDWRFRQSRGAS